MLLLALRLPLPRKRNLGSGGKKSPLLLVRAPGQSFCVSVLVRMKNKWFGHQTDMMHTENAGICSNGAKEETS